MIPDRGDHQAFDQDDRPVSFGKHTAADNECSNSHQNRIQTQYRRGVFEGLSADELTTIQHAFLEKVKMTPTCWLWEGAKDTNGYGTFSVKRDGKWAHYRAHRIAWELFRGESIPEGSVCCHVCDVRVCVRWIDHLFIGSHADNVRDAASKHRLTVPRRKKLSLADRMAIYTAPRDKATGGRLAREFGISKAMISHIRRGRFVGAPEKVF